ncbi:MAG: protoporphyrinogen oxidase [bacterium]|nr:protoporphyrinogen oxidase [bacterium]
MTISCCIIPQSVDLLIIGAGIGGLTAAYEAQKKGIKFLLIEAENKVGGVINTITVDKALLETGPNSCLVKPGIMRLIAELGLEDQVIGASRLAKNRYFHRPDLGINLLAAPQDPLQFITSPFLGLKGKVRLLTEVFTRRSTANDESVHDFSCRHFGEEFTNNVLAAMLSGVWAANIKNLSVRSSLPVIWDWEQTCGSLLKGALTQRKKKISTPPAPDKPANLPTRGIFSFKNGMCTLPDIIMAKLDKNRLMTSGKVTRLTRTTSDDFRWKVEGIDQQSSNPQNFSLVCRQVIIATEASAASTLIREIDHTLSGEISKIPYAPLGVAHLLVNKKSSDYQLDGFGFLTPPHLSQGLLGAIFNSSLFPGRSGDEAWHLVTCFIGGGTFPEMADIREKDKLLSALSQIQTVLQLKEAPHVINTTFYPFAIPTYPLGHYSLQRKVDGHAPHLTFLGNWHRGVSVSDRIEEAVKAIEAIGLSRYTPTTDVRSL